MQTTADILNYLFILHSLCNLGFQPMERNIKDGKRWGSYQAYIEPFLLRENLKIYRYARAAKVTVHMTHDTVIHDISISPNIKVS
jgi:hypothetical protein